MTLQINFNNNELEFSNTEESKVVVNAMTQHDIALEITNHYITAVQDNTRPVHVIEYIITDSEKSQKASGEIYLSTEFDTINIFDFIRRIIEEKVEGNWSARIRSIMDSMRLSNAEDENRIKKLMATWSEMDKMDNDKFVQIYYIILKLLKERFDKLVKETPQEIEAVNSVNALLYT